jgi:hypothetical protein
MIGGFELMVNRRVGEGDGTSDVLWVIGFGHMGAAAGEQGDHARVAKHTPSMQRLTPHLDAYEAGHPERQNAAKARSFYFPFSGTQGSTRVLVVADRDA